MHKPKNEHCHRMKQPFPISIFVKQQLQETESHLKRKRCFVLNLTQVKVGQGTKQRKNGDVRGEDLQKN